jgi:hypothetical protein
MTHVINTLYSILTWLSAFVIGFSGDWGWLGWSLVGMAVLQTWGTLYQAVTKS